MKKEIYCGVVHIETEDFTGIIYRRSDNQYHTYNAYGSPDLEMGDTYVHLYVVTDESVSESDVVLVEQTDGTHFTHKVTEDSLKNVQKIDRKIVASSETNLGVKEIPYNFLSEFVLQNGVMDDGIVLQEDEETVYKYLMSLDDLNKEMDKDEALNIIKRSLTGYIEDSAGRHSDEARDIDKAFMKIVELVEMK
jgi:hypothetical protein